MAGKGGKGKAKSRPHKEETRKLKPKVKKKM